MWCDDNFGVRLHLDTEKAGLGMILGPLELKLMQALWEDGKGRSIKELRHILAETGTVLSLSTILTTMHRLAGKGYVFETRRDGLYNYTPAVGEDDLEHYVVEHVLARLRAEWPGHLTELGVVFDD